MSKFHSVRWGNHEVLQVPCYIVNDQRLQLSSKAIAVFLVLLHSSRSQSKKIPDMHASTKISQKKLMVRTGLSKNIISAAIKELETIRFIECSRNQRRKHKEFGVNEYFLWNTNTNEPLTVAKGKTLFYGNGITYFTMPRCVLLEQEEKWSVAQMSGSELAGYISLLWLANFHRQNEFEFKHTELRKLSGLATPATLSKALEALEARGLIWVITDDRIVLCDPYTGDPLPEPDDPRQDPANYLVIDKNNVLRRFRCNWTEQQVGDLVRACLSQGSALEYQSNGDLKIVCPFHSDCNPSCSVSLKKRCFYCFGCKTKGRILDLIKQLKGLTTTEAISYQAEFVGVEASFEEPDSRAEAIYKYRDKSGKLLKEVLRFPGKKFMQRRPVPGGWLRNVDGVESILYNLDRLQTAGVVIITEGEKDANRMNKLNLFSRIGEEVVATTSGNANSWKESLADELLGKPVVIMGDNDEPGHRYVSEIERSLLKRKIEYRIVSFSDTSANDVSEFLDGGHTVAELVQRIGTDWVYDPAGQLLTPELETKAVPIEA